MQNNSIPKEIIYDQSTTEIIYAHVIIFLETKIEVKEPSWFSKEMQACVVHDQQLC